MKKLILAGSFLISLSCLAQAPAIQEMHRYGGNAFDGLKSMIKTQDGGFLLGGYSNSGIAGVKTEPNVGFNFDYWVIKFDGSLNVEWDKTVGGGDPNIFVGHEGELLTEVREAQGGGYFLGGYSDSPIFGDKTEASYGGEDFWVVKIAEGGNIIWQKDLGGTLDDQLQALEATPDGGCIVGGTSPSDISGNKTGFCRGGTDYWVVKLDASGEIEWQKTIGGDDSDVLSSILVTNDGYLLGGYSLSGISGEKTTLSADGDIWLVKTDLDGNIIWQKTIGGDGEDLFSAVKPTNDGFIIVGESYSGVSGEKTQPAFGAGDYWLVKTDGNGDVLWNRTFGGTLGDSPANIFVDDNGFLIVGWSYSPVSGNKTEPSFGLEDGWVVRTDANGNLLWQTTIGGDSSDEIVDALKLSDGSFLLGGLSISSQSGNMTIPEGSGYWLTKLQPEQLAVNDSSFSKFLVYPNPAHNNITINLNKPDEKITVSIYNALSQKIFARLYKSVSAVDVPLDSSPGVYFVKIENDKGETLTVKLVKK